MKFLLFFFLSFSIFAQKSNELFPVFGNPKTRFIPIDKVVLHIRELKSKSLANYGEAVDFYYRKIASAGKNNWIEKLEEFSLDPVCPAKLKDTIKAQINRIRTLQIGERAPDIDLNDFRLSDFKSEKPSLLLLFYSPSCFHCTELLVDLIPYSEKKELPVIALQIDEDMNPWTFPKNWHSVKVNEITRKNYGVISTPTLYLIEMKSKLIRGIPENLNQLKELEFLF
jgi:thioredoxin-related protein